MSLPLFLRFVLYKYKSIMEYRGAFLAGVWGQGLGYLADFVVLRLLVQKFQTINGWEWPEIALLVSINVLTYAMGATFFYHMTNFDSLVISGGFDRYLTSPLPPLIHLCANQFNIGYIAHYIVAGSFFIWSLVQLQADWTVGTLFFLIVILISGGLMHAAAFIFLGSWAFIFTRSRFLFTLYGALRNFTSYPLSIYGFFIQTLLTFGIPFAFINYYPSAVILSKEEGIFPVWLGFLAPFVALVCFALALRMWGYGVKRYQSAGG